MERLVNNQSPQEYINSLSIDSEEFFELFNNMTDRYWSEIDLDPDDENRRTLAMLANQGSLWMNQVLVQFSSHLFDITEKPNQGFTGSFVVTNSKNVTKSIYFKLANRQDTVDKLRDQMAIDVLRHHPVGNRQPV